MKRITLALIAFFFCRSTTAMNLIKTLHDDGTTAITMTVTSNYLHLLLTGSGTEKGLLSTLLRKNPPLMKLMRERESYLSILPPELKNILYCYTRVGPLVEAYKEIKKIGKLKGDSLTDAEKKMDPNEIIVQLLNRRRKEIKKMYRSRATIALRKLLLFDHPASYENEVKRGSFLLDVVAAGIQSYALKQLSHKYPFLATVILRQFATLLITF